MQQSSIGTLSTLTSRQLSTTGISLDDRKLSLWDNIEVLRNRKTTRKPQVDDIDVESAVQAAGIKDDDWVQKLLDVEEEQLILIICFLMNESNIDSKTIKSARAGLPSFSTTKWSDFAAQAGLPDDPSYLKLGYFKTPVYQLPPSFHNAIFEISWHAQDVNEVLAVQTCEESRVRILDSMILMYLQFLMQFILAVYCPHSGSVSGPSG